MSDVTPTTPAVPPSTHSDPLPPGTPDGAPKDQKAAPPTPPAPTPAAPAKKRYTFKVDGREEHEELTEEEVSLRLQKGRGADKAFNEAAELRKKVQQALELWKRDPFEAVKDPVFEGMDLEALAEKRLAAKYRAEQLKKDNPEEFARYERDQALARREQEIKAWEQQRAAEQQAAMDDYYAREMIQTFDSALEKGGLPRDGETLYMMAEIQSLNLDRGLELTPDQLASAVKERLDGYKTQAKQQLLTLKGDALLAELGEEVVEEVRNTLLARARSMRQPKAPAAPAKTPAAPQEDERPQSQRWQSDSAILRELMRG